MSDIPCLPLLRNSAYSSLASAQALPRLRPDRGASPVVPGGHGVGRVGLQSPRSQQALMSPADGHDNQQQRHLLKFDVWGSMQIHDPHDVSQSRSSVCLWRCFWKSKARDSNRLYYRGVSGRRRLSGSQCIRFAHARVLWWIVAGCGTF